MKIFVITGSGGFDSLVKKIDELVATKKIHHQAFYYPMIVAPTKINSEVTAQIATGEYIPKHINWFRFTERDKLEEYEKNADVIISHCGLMSLMENVRAGRKVIGVTNFDRSDFHQQDLAKKLSDDGLILWCREFDDLPFFIEKAKAWTPKEYVRPDCQIAEEIIKFLGVNK